MVAEILQEDQPSSEPAPLSLQYAAPTEVAFARPMVLPWGGWISCAVATFYVFVNVRTVLISGPVIAVFGSIMMWEGWRRRLMPLAVLGAGFCAVVTLFVMLVNYFNWGPGRAAMPFRWMGIVFTIILLLLTVHYTRGRQPRG